MATETDAPLQDWATNRTFVPVVGAGVLSYDEMYAQTYKQARAMSVQMNGYMSHDAACLVLAAKRNPVVLDADA